MCGCPGLSCPPAGGGCPSPPGRAGFAAQLASPGSEHQRAPGLVPTPFGLRCCLRVDPSHSWAPHMGTGNAPPPGRHWRNLNPKAAGTRDTFLAAKPCAPGCSLISNRCCGTAWGFGNSGAVRTGQRAAGTVTQPRCPVAPLASAPGVRCPAARRGGQSAGSDALGCDGGFCLCCCGELCARLWGHEPPRTGHLRQQTFSSVLGGGHVVLRAVGWLTKQPRPAWGDTLCLCLKRPPDSENVSVTW